MADVSSIQALILASSPPALVKHVEQGVDSFAMVPAGSNDADNIATSVSVQTPWRKGNFTSGALRSNSHRYLMCGTVGERKSREAEQDHLCGRFSLVRTFAYVRSRERTSVTRKAIMVGRIVRLV